MLHALLLIQLLLIAVSSWTEVRADNAQEILGAAPKTARQPNIIFILVDDQDAVYDSSKFMPNLQKHIAKAGATFENHFVIHPVCCPSRTNLLRSQCSHNTNHTSVFAPYGGYTKFHQQHLDDDYLPVWLQNLGYWTGYTGKFLVEYGLTNYHLPPKGWNDFDTLLFPYTFDYLNPVFSRNGEYPDSYEGQYSTDVVSRKTLGLIEQGHASGQPFFIMSAPVGPHTEMTANITCFQDVLNKTTGIALNPLLGMACIKTSDPQPAERHKHLFKDEIVPRTPAFNQKYVSSYPNWLRFLPELSEQNVTRIDEMHRNRLRSLQSIDEMIGAIFEKLDELGNREETYVIYSSDNGFHLGAHRQFAGKETTFEEDIRVPFFIAGPEVTPDAHVKERTLHLDIAPTLVALAGGPFPSTSDGQLLPVPGKHLHGRLLERVAFGTTFYGSRFDEIIAADTPIPRTESGEILYLPGHYANFNWRGIRIQKDGYGAFKYAVYCEGPSGNDHELYDLVNDPHELVNIYSEYLISNKSFIDRLDAHLTVSGTCKSAHCVNPTLFLHPDGSAKDFFDTLDEKFDEQYARYPNFYFKRCVNYPDVENEVGFVNLTYVPEDGSGFEKSQLVLAGVDSTVDGGFIKIQERPSLGLEEASSKPLDKAQHDFDPIDLLVAAPFIWH